MCSPSCRAIGGQTNGRSPPHSPRPTSASRRQTRSSTHRDSITAAWRRSRTGRSRGRSSTRSCSNTRSSGSGPARPGTWRRSRRRTCSASPAPSQEISQPAARLSPPVREEPRVQETEKIWMNGELVDWADAKVHVGVHGLHYGTGVFEGIRCYDTPKGPAVFRLKDHIQRLHNSARLLYMEIPFSVDDLMSAT